MAPGSQLKANVTEDYLIVQEGYSSPMFWGTMAGVSFHAVELSLTIKRGKIITLMPNRFVIGIMDFYTIQVVLWEYFQDIITILCCIIQPFLQCEVLGQSSMNV